MELGLRARGQEWRLGARAIGLGLWARAQEWRLGARDGGARAFGTRAESAVSEIKVHPLSTTKSGTVRRSEGVGGFLKQKQRLLSGLLVTL